MTTRESSHLKHRMRQEHVLRGCHKLGALDFERHRRKKTDSLLLGNVSMVVHPLSCAWLSFTTLNIGSVQRAVGICCVGAIPTWLVESAGEDSWEFGIIPKVVW